MQSEYEFRIHGRLSGELLRTFTPTAAHVEAGDTVFSTPVQDRAELFAVIARCETLGLDLISLSRSETTPVESGGLTRTE